MRFDWWSFTVGGFTGLAVARHLARWWRRLFWVAAAAVFGAGALLLLRPGSLPPGVFRNALRAAQAATQALTAGGTDLP